MFVPDCDASVVDVILSCCEFALAVEINLHDWIDSMLSRHLDVLCLLNVNVYHIVAALHMAHSFFVVAFRNVRWVVVWILIFHFFLLFFFFWGRWRLACNGRLVGLVLFSKGV